MARVGAQPIGIGKGPAGVDPVSPYSPAPSLAVKAGVQYLGQNADYNELEADPIDVDMALSLAVPQGSVKHAPDLGNLLHTINPLGRPNEHEAVVDIVNRSNPLARRVTAGDVSITKIDSDSKGKQLRVQVTYKNPRRNSSKTVANS